MYVIFYVFLLFLNSIKKKKLFPEQLQLFLNFLQDITILHKNTKIDFQVDLNERKFDYINNKSDVEDDDIIQTSSL